MNLVSRLIKRVGPALHRRASSSGVNLGQSVTTYWTEHNVTLHRTFASAEESLRDFHWRNDQYYRYIDLMPVDRADGLTVLDFGCGPGYDLVGFAVSGRPSRLIGVDVSSSSLAEARHRLKLHGAEPEFIHHDVARGPMPLPDASVDLVHSSGVLHHLPSINPALKELRRVLKPGGRAQIMVYHADSIWAHLYVAFDRQLLQGMGTELTLEDAFQASTDGEDCPVSRCYTQQQFTDLMMAHGFEPEGFGVAVSAWEMTLLPKRFPAIMDSRLPERSRRFLADLTFDERGLPLARPGVHAGVDACFSFRAA